MLAHLNSWCIKGVRKPNLALKKLVVPQFFIPWAKTTLENFDTFGPLSLLGWSDHKCTCKCFIIDTNLKFYIHRIYDISNPHKAMQVHGLGEHPTSFSLSSSRSTFEVALGEIAVSFDFGLPVEIASRAGSGAKEDENLLYPVYILKGNGDIFLLNISLTDRRWVTEVVFHT